VFHYKLHQYAMDSTMGSRTDLTRIEPSEKGIEVLTGMKP
jgi:hypothetical protein